MEEIFVTKEIALKVQELGFDKNKCIMGLSEQGRYRHKFAIDNTGSSEISWFKYDNDIPLPTWEQVIEWFRIFHHIYIWISYSKGYDNPYSGYIIILNKTNGITTGYSKSYEESRKRVILKAIELCKNNSELTE